MGGKLTEATSSSPHSHRNETGEIDIKGKVRMGAVKCRSKGLKKTFKKNVFRPWKFCRPRL